MCMYGKVFGNLSFSWIWAAKNVSNPCNIRGEINKFRILGGPCPNPYISNYNTFCPGWSRVSVPLTDDALLIRHSKTLLPCYLTYLTYSTNAFLVHFFQSLKWIITKLSFYVKIFIILTWKCTCTNPRIFKPWTTEARIFKPVQLFLERTSPVIFKI